MCVCVERDRRKANKKKERKIAKSVHYPKSNNEIINLIMLTILRLYLYNFIWLNEQCLYICIYIYIERERENQFLENGAYDFDENHGLDD